MNSLLRLILLGVAAFCAFGFAATLEPIERGQQLMWRTAYGVVGVASIACMAWTLVTGRGARSPEGSDE